MTKPAIYAKKAITVKFPLEVWTAMEKRVDQKKKKFPRYAEVDVIRTSVVKHLKEKGFLDRNKDYL